MAPQSTQDSSKPVECKGKKILPVRYALSSTAANSSGCKLLQHGELEKLTHHHYTLRTINKGYIFINYEAMGDEVAVFEARNGSFIRKYVKDVAPALEQGCLCVPEDVKSINICYLRVPENGQTDAIEQLWPLVLENIKANPKNSELMQSVTFEAPPYSALLSDTAQYIEEFKEADRGRLEYIGDIDEVNTLFNRSGRFPDGAPATYAESWNMSVDFNAKCKKLSVYPEDATVVALHDSQGLIDEFVKLNADNLGELALYKTWQAPCRADGAMLDLCVSSVRANAVSEHDQAEELIYGLFHNQPRISEINHPFIDLSASYAENMAKLERMYPSHHRGPIKMKDEGERAVVDVSGNTLLMLAERTGVHQRDLKDIFARRDRFINKYVDDLNTIRGHMAKVAEDWSALLGSDKNFSIEKVLKLAFAASDQSGADPMQKIESLTLARDAVFAGCHSGLAALSDYHAHLEALFNTGVYKDMLANVVGRGNAPGQELGAYLLAMRPFLAHMLRKEGWGGVMTLVFSEVAKRFALDDFKLLTLNEKPLEKIMEELAAAVAESDEEAQDWISRFTATGGPAPSLVAELSDTLGKGADITSNFLDCLYEAAKGWRIPISEVSSAIPLRTVTLALSEKGGLKAENSSGSAITRLLKGSAKTQSKVETLQRSEMTVRFDESAKGQAALDSMQRAASAASVAAGVMAFLNCLFLLEKAAAAPKSSHAVNYALQAVAQAAGSAEVFCQIANKRFLANILRRFAGPAGIVTTLAEAALALDERDYGAALGAMLTGSALTLMLFSSRIAAMFAAGAAAPVLAVFFSLFSVALLGVAIASAYGDDDYAKTIKNSMFYPPSLRVSPTDYEEMGYDTVARIDRLDDMQHLFIMHSALRGGGMPELWAKEKKHADQDLGRFCAPLVSLGLDSGLCYCDVSAVNFNPGQPWSVEVTPYAVVDNRDYEADPYALIPDLSQAPFHEFELGPEHLLPEYSIFRQSNHELYMRFIFDRAKIEDGLGGLRHLRLKVNYKSGPFSTGDLYHQSSFFGWWNAPEGGRQLLKEISRKKSG